MLIILDRDGVINQESRDYIKSPEEWIPIPGSIEAIVRLKQAGHLVVIATNQSGVGRGLFNEMMLSHIHQKMTNELMKHSVVLDGIYYCPHHPDALCRCRKPKPGLLEQINEDFPDFCWKNAIMVGDSFNDVGAASEVGCPAVLVKTGKGRYVERLRFIDKFDNLADFATYLLKK